MRRPKLLATPQLNLQSLLLARPPNLTSPAQRTLHTGQRLFHIEIETLRNLGVPLSLLPENRGAVCPRMYAMIMHAHLLPRFHAALRTPSSHCPHRDH